MSTRGLYGFRMNGVEKLTYNHCDSYPDCLGAEMASFCEDTPVSEMKEIFSRIVMVEETDEWYNKLRNHQGELDWMKNSSGPIYMIDNHDFIKYSLFCEYAYIIDLDTEKLEYWIGWQKKPWEDNPYGTECDNGYYPCKRYAEFDFGVDADDVVRVMNGIDPDEDPNAEDQDVESKICDAAEALGWSVHFDGDYILFSNHSPAGEDLEVELEWDSDLDALIEALDVYSDDFDVDEHVYMWLEAKHNGQCAPSARELVDDADAIQDMLFDLYQAIADLN